MVDQYILDLERLNVSSEVEAGDALSLLAKTPHLGLEGIDALVAWCMLPAACSHVFNQETWADVIRTHSFQVDLSNKTTLDFAAEQVRAALHDLPLPAQLTRELASAIAELPLKEGEVYAVRPVFTDQTEYRHLKKLLPFTMFSTTPEVLKNHIKHQLISLIDRNTYGFGGHEGWQGICQSVAILIQKVPLSDEIISGTLVSKDSETSFADVVTVRANYGMPAQDSRAGIFDDEFCVHKRTCLEGRPATLKRSLGAKQRTAVLDKDGLDRDGQRGECSYRVEPTAADKRRRFCVDDGKLTPLVRASVELERLFGAPVKLGWYTDLATEQTYITTIEPMVQEVVNHGSAVEKYLLKESGTMICEGRAIGHKISSGRVRIIRNKHDLESISDQDIIVAEATEPKWEPYLRRAAGVITDRGGRTCHTAIAARELGIPAIVGCGDATERLGPGQPVTVSCAEGDAGRVYLGNLEFEHHESTAQSLPELPIDVLMTTGNPDRAFELRSLPNAGLGLARLEFIINRMIGIHPKAILDVDMAPEALKATIERRCEGYASPMEFYINRLVEGIATLAAAFYPKPVTVRLSDFKSNEYSHLIGGDLYETHEENPLLGLRGATRYVSEEFRGCFELECQALKRVREDMGFDNVQIMVPFVRTVAEASQVTDLLAENGLKRGERGLKVVMMCEIPSNIILADQFLAYFDGYSIGSNDLTQLTLGVDRDSHQLAHLFNERDESVQRLILQVVKECKRLGKAVTLCGQGPSDYPDVAKWLMEIGVEGLSLNPDSILDTWFSLAES
ncbi:MAG: phosphoenolpyruvate synthase [Pontibacterium sp.]